MKPQDKDSRFIKGCDDSKPMRSVRFLVNAQGRKKGVLIAITLREKNLDELEESESMRAYDKAKASGDEILLFEKAV
ncbi:MAG: hypothetical protein JW682_07140, partial [Campylobacterales bacterium]|nr:hypothetical protein [Campylobacterales bacterium]